MERVRIAIDGPVAAGKSTVARALARRLGLRYLDTGAMYRALAWAARRRGIGPQDERSVRGLLLEFDLRVDLAPGGDCRVAVGSQDITDDIRTQDIGELASALSALPFVREWMVARQQALARDGDIVAEGRDIQTVVIPDAEIKVFLTASEAERARRSQRDRQTQGDGADLKTVLAELRRRDHRDSSRAHAPLRAAPDAVTLDSTGMTIDEVVGRIVQLVRARFPDDPEGPDPRRQASQMSWGVLLMLGAVTAPLVLHFQQPTSVAVALQVLFGHMILFTAMAAVVELVVDSLWAMDRRVRG